MKDVISVIVPVYNVSAYLPECLDSILSQDYDKLEVILIDDGSTDDSGTVCDAYAQRDNRIRVIHQKNGGAAAAKNAGLRAATGEYLSFADSDDFLEPGAYAYMMSLLKENGADIVRGAFQNRFRTRTEQWLADESRCVMEGKAFLARFATDWTCGLLWNKLYKRALFDGIFFEEGHKIDDEYFTYQGVDNASSDGNPYREGYVELGMEDDETTVDFSIRLIEMRTEGDSEDWAIPFADSVNISEMSESDMNSAQMGLVGVIGEVAATLQEQIARHRPNDKVKLSVKRDGDVKQIDVTLRNKAGKTELITKEDVDVVEALGGKFADAGTKLCRELDIRGGVQVVGVKQGGILSRARVKQGFVITHINDAPVYSLSDMERMTEKIRSIDGIYPNGRSASYMLVE